MDVPEVWLRFLVAIVGLLLAFGAALFSTVARESGNLWTTVILATVALILATLVGVTTVPYLARRVAAGRVRDAFDYEVTRTGTIYVVVVLLVGVAALNTGNNLLYIIVAAMLAAIVVSGFASAVILRGLELEVRLPDHVFAGRPVLAWTLLRNRRTRVPAFSVHVIPIKKDKVAGQWRWTPTTFAFPPNREPGKQWLRLPDRQLRRVLPAGTPPAIFDSPVYFPFVPAGETLSADLRLNFERRGRYQQESFGISTRFPFAFLTKTRRVPLNREIVVYPRVAPPDELFEVLPLITGEFETFARGRGSDLYRIREYTQEDPVRHVDWKATAKSGSLKVREFTREDERKLRIVFDNPEEGSVSSRAYENAVSLAASLAWHFANQNTDLSFVAQDHRQSKDVYKFLENLATVSPGSSASVVPGLPITDDYNIIFTTQPRASIPAALWACSYFVLIGDENPNSPR